MPDQTDADVAFEQTFQDCLTHQLLPKSMYLQLMLTMCKQYHMLFSKMPETMSWLPSRPEGLNVIFQQMLTHADLVEMAKGLYLEHFTREELRELVAFSVSPVGQKLANKGSMLAAEAGQLAEAQVSVRFMEWLDAQDAAPKRAKPFDANLAHLFALLVTKETLPNGDYASICSNILHQFARDLKLLSGTYKVDASKAPLSVTLLTDKGFVLSFLPKDALQRAGGAAVSFRRCTDLVDANDCLVTNHIWKFSEIAADYDGFLNEMSLVLQGLKTQ